MPQEDEKKYSDPVFLFSLQDGRGMTGSELMKRTSRDARRGGTIGDISMV
jgi:hypothetical protein